MSRKTLAKVVAALAALLCVLGVLTALAVAVGFFPSPLNQGAVGAYVVACIALLFVAMAMNDAR